ncbi:MAG: hypothetical protein OHK0044_29230 [Burkholderiaceae bacterium]
MRHIDVFNGDADGLCALHQLRLAEPADAELVTGLKRDIELLARVRAGADCAVTVLDIALDRNRAALERLLAEGARVRWFDHHYAGAAPTHARLELHIDCAPSVCTSILVDRHLGGRFRRWAVVAAFGDNLRAPARELAAALGLDAARTETLRALGEALNYNAYGETEADVLIHPRELYRVLHAYVDPFEFAAREAIAAALIDRCRADLAAACAVAPEYADDRCTLYRLPDAPWARRVLGTFAHRLAADDPQRAHAVARANADGSFTISVRAPRGADALCRQFPRGGGRSTAAGIDRLPAERLDEFIRRFRARHWREEPNR